MEKARREVDAVIKSEGERAALETAFRGSTRRSRRCWAGSTTAPATARNVLQHSIEVSHIAGLMAAELGLDVNAAKRAGLLHDIGKALDHEFEGTHVTWAWSSAASTRRKRTSSTPSRLTTATWSARPWWPAGQAADAISAARPGARRGESGELYQAPGEAGGDYRQLSRRGEVPTPSRPAERSGSWVKPEQVSEDQMVILARELAGRIESELEYPGQIKVHVIRETKVVEYAK